MVRISAVFSWITIDGNDHLGQCFPNFLLADPHKIRKITTDPHIRAFANMVRQDDFFFFPPWRCGPTRAMASSFLRFLDHTQRRTTVDRTPLDE